MIHAYEEFNESLLFYRCIDEYYNKLATVQGAAITR